MSSSPLVLVVEDEKILAESIGIFLERHRYATAVAHSGEDGVRLAEELGPDVAVMDIRLPGMDGLTALERIREAAPGIEAVIMTAHATVPSAVEAMRRGAFDYLSKPVDLDELRLVIEKALAHLRLTRELSYLRARGEERGHLSRIIGTSLPVQALRRQIQHIASLDGPDPGAAPTVLLLGETGTGKELVARAIHYESARAAGPFVEINCAALPTALLEAELFGYERGAFTDAKTAKPGLFEAAEGGTLFLDEIGHLEPSLQVKLLKAIEEKSVRRLGALRPKNVRARIVAATNRDLDKAIAEGAFRQDLYFRVKVLTLELPPLRARGEDVLLLARHFLDERARQYGRPTKHLTPAAEALLMAYPWPGNVRELAHVMERAVLLHGGPVVDAEDLGLASPAASPPAAGVPATPVAVGSDRRVQVDFSSGGIVLDDVERQLILEALAAARWNRTRAAELLGISRDTLRYRMEKFRLQQPS